MKKVLFCMMVAVSAMMMTSCEGKNEPQKPDGDDTTKVTVDTVAVAALMNFEFEADAKMLEAFKLTVEYYDENSELKSEVFNGEKIAKKIITKGLPAKTGVRFTVEKKADLDTTVVTQFESEYSFSYETYAVNKAGERANAWKFLGGRTGEHVQHPINMIDKYLAAMARDEAKVYEFDANGKPTEKIWE